MSLGLSAHNIPGSAALIPSLSRPTSYSVQGLACLSNLFQGELTECLCSAHLAVSLRKQPVNWLHFNLFSVPAAPEKALR